MITRIVISRLPKKKKNLRRYHVIAERTSRPSTDSRPRMASTTRWMKTTRRLTNLLPRRQRRKSAPLRRESKRKSDIRKRSKACRFTRTIKATHHHLIGMIPKEMEYGSTTKSKRRGTIVKRYLVFGSMTYAVKPIRRRKRRRRKIVTMFEKIGHQYICGRCSALSFNFNFNLLKHGMGTADRLMPLRLFS